MLRIHIYLPSSRPNSVLKISFHRPSSSVGALGSRMSRTMWLALFCLIGLGPAIAIKFAAPPASLVVEPAQDQSKTEPAFALNESAKSDRLELPNARARLRLSSRLRSRCLRKFHRPVPRQSRRSRAGISKTPTPGPSRSRHLVGILKAENRRRAQAYLPRTQEPRSGTADRTPWAAS